ncbi:hypothetical protein Q9233_012926 [Columba guinea]|nr:hypothetical protein Q9233_012926 [Columba guinea]
MAEHPVYRRKYWNRSPTTYAVVFQSFKMTEGRRCQVHLLDDRKLELLVQVRSHSRAQDLSPACLLCFSISSGTTPDWEMLVALSQHWTGKVPHGLVTHCHPGSCRQRGHPSGDVQFRAHGCPLLL